MKRFENDNALLRAAIWADRIEVFIKVSSVIVSLALCLGVTILFFNR